MDARHTDIQESKIHFPDQYLTTWGSIGEFVNVTVESCYVMRLLAASSRHLLGVKLLRIAHLPFTYKQPP